MKINEVEQQVGISKKNIRFYEQQGLLSPKRNSENGYREYGETDVLCLKKIKLFRKLSLPIEEIRRIQSGDLLLADALKLLAAIAFILIMFALIGMLIWGYTQDPIPNLLFGIFMMVPIIVILAVIVALLQRIKELEGGEEDAARKY